MTSFRPAAAISALGLLPALVSLLWISPALAQDRYSSTARAGNYEARQDGATTPYCCTGQERAPAEDPADWVDPCNLEPQCPRYGSAAPVDAVTYEAETRHQTTQYQARGAMPPCPADRLARIGCPPAPRAESLTLPDSFFYGGGGVGSDYVGAEGGGVVIVVGGGASYALARASASSSVSIRIGGGRGGHGGGGGHGHPGRPGGGGCGCGH